MTHKSNSYTNFSQFSNYSKLPSIFCYLKKGQFTYAMEMTPLTPKIGRMESMKYTGFSLPSAIHLCCPQKIEFYPKHIHAVKYLCHDSIKLSYTNHQQILFL